MPRLTISILAAATAAAALGGCAYRNPGFGDAVHQNLSAQIADPDAKYARIVGPASDGPRTAVAQERYQEGAIKEAASASTTTINISGGGGGGK